MDGFRYMDGVATLQLADAACIGCGMCEEVCPHGVFDVAEGKARILDHDACMECGACAMNCPTKAISVTPGRGVRRRDPFGVAFRLEAFLRLRGVDPPAGYRASLRYPAPPAALPQSSLSRWSLPHPFL